MALSKSAVVELVRDEVSSAPATVLTEYRGLSVGDMAALREALRESGARYRVAKNTLIWRALADLDLDVPREVLTGPTAVAFTGEDLGAAAKALKKFAKDHPSLVVKGALLEGEFLDAERAAALADLPSRDELLAEILGMLETMLSAPLSLSDALLTEVAGLLEALEAEKS